MALSKEREQLIKDIANGNWVTRLPPKEDQKPGEFEEKREEFAVQLEKFLDTCSSAEELHMFVEWYNWDDGEENLLKVIDNPHCDRNTALLVFWLGSPDFYQEYGGEEDFKSTHDFKAWSLLQRIQSNVLAGKYPEEKMADSFKNEIVKPSKKRKWEIHSEMYGGVTEIPTPSNRLR